MTSTHTAQDFPMGLTISPIDLSDTERAISGQSYSDIRSQYDEIEIEFPDMIGETQSGQMIALAHYCGTHTPFFVSIEPSNKGYAWLYYVKAKSLTARTVHHINGSTVLWKASLKLAEEL
jgi:hypothetical protein